MGRESFHIDHGVGAGSIAVIAQAGHAPQPRVIDDGLMYLALNRGNNRTAVSLTMRITGLLPHNSCHFSGHFHVISDKLVVTDKYS